jgi:transposase
VLCKAAERLSDRQWQRLEAAWTAGDPRDEVYNAWAVKELLRDVYAASTVHDARVALGEFYDWAHSCAVPETARLARTIKRWETEILAWHTTGGASNGPTEAVNLLIKKVQRTGHGFRNFTNYRLRLLLHCGVTWQDQPAARLRRRQPRSAA